MTSQIVKVLFLLENVGLGKFFVPGKAPQNDGTIHLGGELGATRGVDAVGFALAALLGAGEIGRQ